MHKTHENIFVISIFLLTLFLNFFSFISLAQIILLFLKKGIGFYSYFVILKLNILFLFSRYQIVRNIDSFGTIISGSDTRPTWYIIFAIFSGLLMHVPYFLQFEMEPCRDEKEGFIYLNCWIAHPRYVRNLQIEYC